LAISSKIVTLSLQVLVIAGFDLGAFEIGRALGFRDSDLLFRVDPFAKRNEALPNVRPFSASDFRKIVLSGVGRCSILLTPVRLASSLVGY
jgi:hypothetical protein